MAKTFTSAGVSKQDGKFSFRATNREGDTYQEILKKEGHTEVHIVKLKHSMSKEEAKKYCASLKHFQTDAILKCLKDDAQPAKKEKDTAKKGGPKVTKAPSKKAKSTTKKTSTKKTKNDGEIETAEAEHDDSVDVNQELGQPAFTKHVEEA